MLGTELTYTEQKPHVRVRKIRNINTFVRNAPGTGRRTQGRSGRAGGIEERQGLRAEPLQARLPFWTQGKRVDAELGRPESAGMCWDLLTGRF